MKYGKEFNMAGVFVMENKEFHTVRGYQMLDQERKKLTSGMEDYLEMIYRNCEKNSFLRISKLTELLNVKASSATKMAQKLGELGLLSYEKYGIIILTEAGKEHGRFLLDRHCVIESFLKAIGISENILTETELIEHNISNSTLGNIKILNCFFNDYPVFQNLFREYKAVYLESMNNKS